MKRPANQNGIERAKTTRKNFSGDLSRAVMVFKEFRSGGCGRGDINWSLLVHVSISDWETPRAASSRSRLVLAPSDSRHLDSAGNVPASSIKAVGKLVEAGHSRRKTAGFVSQHS